ncbi:MAG: glutaminase [Nocardioides sp.]|uniref:glutaminase n=1 Tax=Nocardioides sp. TaxID=35761 RepID=UPI00239770E5|nr:glutaminase [Nocardioides sp.]MDE0775728.1 glutaminase [Nocardioides sp.]
MRSPIPDYLLEVLDSCGADAGAVADYIPELAAANPERFGICVATVDGAVYAAGDADVEFTIQSMSKPFTYALALADRGVAEMDERVGVEPSGEAFNEISLDPETGRPRNAMINAGALLTHSLVDGEDAAARSQRVLAGFSRFAGRDLVVDESAFSSEFASAHRNLGMAHLLKASGVLECDPVEVVEGYTRQCSITVSCRDLAMMAATLANAGTHPLTQERLLSRPVVRQVMSVMMTCGMYDAAGDWMTDVGIPAKSGVSGGVIGALPGQVGVAVFSPRLDTHGSSVRGVQVFERLSGDMGMHLMDVAQEGRSALRGSYVSEGEDAVTVYEMQGDLRFSGAETVVRAIAEADHTTTRVALDLTRVYRLHDVGRRMLLECVRRLELDGRGVLVIDPEHTLPPAGSSDGLHVVDSLEEVVARGTDPGRTSP